jgi:hypothetical protein
MTTKCINTLDIFGKNTDLIIFFQENRIIPINNKKLLNQNILTFQNAIQVDPNNYKLTKKMWGTKYDAELIDWDDEFTFLRMEGLKGNSSKNEINKDTFLLEQMFYKFKTHRNPPYKWLEFVAKKYNNLEFNLNYENEDDGYIGEIIYRNGELFHSILTKYEEQAWNLLGKDLIDEIKLYYKRENKNPQIIEQLKEKQGNHYLKLKKIIEDYDNIAKYITHRVMDNYIENINNE